MSIHVSSRVWAECPQRHEKLLLMLALADFANDEGYCWPSQTSLAERTRCTERGVRKMVKALEKQGEVTVLSRGDGRGKTTKFMLERYAMIKGERRSGLANQKGGTSVHERGNVETGKGEPTDTPILVQPSEEPSTGEERVLSYWNRNGDSLPKVRQVTDERRKKLRRRLGDDFFRTHWQEAIDRLRASAFCRGDNDRGWRADFDWFLKPSSLPKIIEGKYDDKEKRRSKTITPENALL